MKNSKNGFTLLEVLTVVIIIGILSALAWSSMNDLIQTNKAKEASRTIAAFAERAIGEGRMRKEIVTIKVNGNTIEARFGEDGDDADKEPSLSQALSGGFDATDKNTPPGCENLNEGATAEIRIGTSGMPVGCFVVCNGGGSGEYCGGAIKIAEKNSLTAHFKKRGSSDWREL